MGGIDVVLWGPATAESERTIRAFGQNVSQWLEAVLWTTPQMAIGQPDVTKLEAPTRSALLARVLEEGRAECLALVDLARSPVLPRRDGLAAMVLALDRDPRAALVYSDYTEVGASGSAPRRVLSYHPGRVRDDFDLGAVVLLSKERLIKAGGVCSDLRVGDLYDLRLRLSECFDVVRMAGPRDGHPYSCASPRSHDVFAYLLDDPEAQLEAERVCTEHLKRTGAYLAPAQNLRPRPHAVDEAHKELLASVIIPVYRRPEFIGMAVESVLLQTVSDVEVIVVVNGGDADPTIDKVRDYMPGGSRYRQGPPWVRLIVTDVNNIGFCLNLGLRESKGRYYVQLDSDDVLKPEAVEGLTSALAADKCAGVAVGSYEIWEMDDQGRHRRSDLPVVTHDEWTPENGRNNLLRVNGAGAPRAAPVELLKHTGWFGVGEGPGAANYGEDYDMILRLSESYRVVRLYEPLYEVTRHAGGTDHAVTRETVDEQNDAKDWFRLQAIRRRQAINAEACPASCS
jgi:glycosyltransferase involved in cell wall biosynthesis